MSAISIETKKVTELTAFTTPTDSCLIPIHDGTGLKKITFANFRAKTVEGTEAKIAPLLFNNAGAHNAIYRGKSLGSTVTTAQYAAIKAGTFDDLYIGDYWIIDGVNYRIAAFDYYFNSGDTSCTTHHVVIVPDTCLYNAQMHNTSSGGYEGGAANTTTGGYVGSDMYKSNLEQAKTTIKGAFSGHVLKHRIYLTNAVANGRASGGAWCDSEVDLMCEQMVYGSGIFSPVSDGSNVPANYRVEKSQLPLFQHEPSRICNRATWWLRDVITDTGKVDVPSDGKTLYRVQTGAFSKRSNADAWAAKLKAAGFDTYIVQMGNLYKVQVGAYSQKSNAENMMAKLKAAGYDAFITTKSGTAAGTAKKSAAEIAKEIYNGTCSDARWSSWGNGTDRVNRLKQAGYDPSEVQSEVNKLF